MPVELTIVLRKTMTDQAAAETLYDQVKTKLADKPGIRLTGKTSTNFANDEIEVTP